MGLDMYLTTNSKKVCRAANDAAGAEPWHFANGVAAYWRKANHIHNWFVENVQDGIDDCGSYQVSVEQLMMLRDVCAKVLANSKLVEDGTEIVYSIAPIEEKRYRVENASVADELLPTMPGFFFGSTDYDAHYIKEVERTKNVLDAIFANIESYENDLFSDGYTWHYWREVGEEDGWNVRFEYHASW